MADLIPSTTTPQNGDSLWQLAVRAVNALASLVSLSPTRASGTAFASQARTGTQQSADIPMGTATGIILFFRCSAAGTGNLSISLFGRDPASGAVLFIAGSTTTMTGAGAFTLSVGKGAGGLSTGTTNGCVSAILPDNVIVQVTPSDGSSWTYSVGYAKR